MKQLLLSFLVSLIFQPFQPSYSQGLSPQAQAVINRLPPGQRAMALQEASRLRGHSGGNQPTSAVTPVTQEEEEISNDEADEHVVEEDEVLILSDLEFSVGADLKLEKENLLEAKKGLSAVEFFEIEKIYTDRIYDMEKLLAEIKTAKINFLKEKVIQIQDDPEEEIKPFGYDFFNNSLRYMDRSRINSIPSNYNIGPGDYLEIQLFGQENAGYSVIIGQNGIIQFPGIGPINAFENGGSFQNLKNLLKGKVREHLGEGVQVSISMGEVRQIKVFLAGEFNKPGLRLLSATSTIIEALLQSGGLNEYGSLRKATLKRSGQPDKIYDFYGLLLNGDNPAIDSLMEGDVVFLPRVDSRVVVSGEVARPAVYELSNPDSLADVIRLAGGFSSQAYPSEIRLSRMDQFGNKSLNSLSFELDKDFKVKNGDVIEIGSSTDYAKTAVNLVGEVDREGEYEWNKNTKLSDVISNKFIFSDNADLNYALIRRLNDDGSVKVLSFSPKGLLEGIQKTKDIPLNQKDKIIILSKFDGKSRERIIRPLLKELSYGALPAIGANIVTVDGEVHFAGDYPQTLGMKVKDLIIAAGGMKESAYSLSAEISRISFDLNNSKQDAVVKHFLINSLQNENSLNKLLYPGDVLSIKKIPAWQESRIVTLSGEVKFPGQYTISKNEKLGEVFKRAGGLNNSAFAMGSVFTRELLVLRENEQKDKLIQQLESDIASLSLSPISGETSQKANSVAQSLLISLKNSKSVGRLVIDLDKQIKSDQNSQITLRDGDKIHVPIVPSEVSILGEVQFPTSHLYNSGLSVDQYINLSGGFTQNADEKRIFVVKSNGAVLTKKGSGWFSGNQAGNKVQAGDVIVVPINLQKGRWLETLTSSTQIVYQLAVTAAALNSF
ncbi:MAG: SLBB domain-containing protein [Opitutales bacterium]